MAWEDEFSPQTKKDSIVPGDNDILVYGTSWCGMTQMIRRYLDKAGVPYKFVDLELNPGSVDQLRWITGGYAKHPTVVIDGQALIEPSVSEVGRALARSGYI